MTLHEYDVKQGTDEWLDLRKGLITASVVGQLVTMKGADPLAVRCSVCGSAPETDCTSLVAKKPTTIKNPHPRRIGAALDLPPVYVPATGDTARGLVATLAAERITGTIEDSYMNRDMERGWKEEPRARERYAETREVEVRETGLFVRTEADWTLGYSPDGLVGDEGLIEVKAPRAKGHVLAVLADAVPANNMAQLQAALLVTGRTWVDYIPWRGGQPMWVKRVYADPSWHAAIVAACQLHEKAIQQMVTDYTAATKGLPTTEPMPDLEMN